MLEMTGAKFWAEWWRYRVQSVKIWKQWFWVVDNFEVFVPLFEFCCNFGPRQCLDIERGGMRGSSANNQLSFYGRLNRFRNIWRQRRSKRHLLESSISDLGQLQVKSERQRQCKVRHGKRVLALEKDRQVLFCMCAEHMVRQNSKKNIPHISLYNWLSGLGA